MNVQVAKRNAWLALAASFLSDLAFILPVWLLYSINELHLSSTLAVTVFMCIWLTSGLLEIPTGAVADRWGRKKVFIIGNLLLALYPLAYVFDAPVPLLISICLLSGVGSALRSGALLPLVHKSFEEAGLSGKPYNTFLSNNSVVSFGARAISGVAGAALYTMDPVLPFIAMTVVYVMSVGVGLVVVDAGVDEKIATNREHIAQTLRVMKQSQVIVSFLVCYVAFVVAAEALWTGYQVFFEADGRSAFVIGLLFSVVAVASATGAYAARHLFRKASPLRIMQFYGLTVLANGFLLWQPNLDVRLLAVLPMGFVSGTLMVTMHATAQQATANRFHSTALSVMSFVQYGVYALGSLGVGVLLDSLGVATTRQVLFMETLLVFVVIMGYVQLQNAKTRNYRIDMSTEIATDPPL
jgi:MFS family permease